MLLTSVTANPVITRCFHGGQLIAEERSDSAISEYCIKDDISIIKSEITHTKNATGEFAHSKVFRYWTIKDWKLCKPILMAGGSINVIEVDKKLRLQTKTYVCDQDCTITIDKENAQILFQTDDLNHFEVTGTTISTGWFKNKASVSLDQTCEHLKASCGKKSIQFHACFKQHMACVRFLHRSILPGKMAVSICQNIELIIIISLAILIFLILIIIAKTYICYLLLPIFMPLAYFYGWVYNRSCKKCTCCGLAYHPFTNCGSHCVCGARFETSDRMRLHRESGLCRGFKSLRVARKLCKSKGSSLILSILISILILSFVTPIEGMLTDAQVKSRVELNSLSDKIMNYEITQEANHNTLIWINMANVIINLVLIVIPIILTRALTQLVKLNIVYCDECAMYHEKKGIKYFGDFTNKCGYCTCGELENQQQLSIHKARQSCIYNYKLIWVKRIVSTILVLAIIQNCASLTAADDSCWTETNPSEKCLGPLIAPEQCLKKEHKTYRGEAAQLVAFKKITQEETNAAELLGTTIESGIQAINSQGTFTKKHLLEVLFLQKHCDYYSLYKHNSGYSQAKWRALVKTFHFDVCSMSASTPFCMCMTTSNCDTENLNLEGTLNTLYQNKLENFKHDLSLFLDVAIAAFPGTSASYMTTNIKQKKGTTLTSFFDKIISKFPSNKLLVAILKFGNYLLKHNNANNYELTSDQEKYIFSVETHMEQKGDQTALSSAVVGQETATCKLYKEIHCLTPRMHIPVTNLSACGDQPNYQIYKTPDKVYKAHDRVETWCIGDMHCLQNYVPAEPDQVERLKKLKCWLKEPAKLEDKYSTPSKTCRVDAKGICKVLNSQWEVLQCDNGLTYFTDHIEGDDIANDLGNHCISIGCLHDRYPINAKVLNDCKWDYKSKKVELLKNIELHSIEELKRVLSDKLTHNLETYSFKPLSSLPHIKPKYQFITISGTETVDGIEGSYITFEMPAIGGTSSGYHIQTKDGQELLDVIVFVKEAILFSDYTHIYDTGPTIGINVRHDEKCTGSCPAAIPHEQNWLTFSQERTSRWGCEEYGCLAINTGCVFGSCQDIIRPEAKVYRKNLDDDQLIEVCINYPGKTFCTDVNPLEPKITETLEIQVKTVDIKSLPQFVVIQNHKLYTGQINDLGSFGSYCGNVQKTNSSLIGSGTPKFDYTCYSASRKDVIVRRCYTNNFDSCKLLQENKNVIFEDNHETIVVKNKNYDLGSISIKLHLGDINYKSFTEDLDLQVDAKCVGCPNCFEAYSCSFQIETLVDTICTIKGPCEISHNRIKLSTNQQTYALKMFCKTKPSIVETFFICNKKYDITFDTIIKNDKIELNTGDQTSYIKEQDLRCKTWLCRVRDEGIGLIFQPIKDILGSYFHTGMVIIAVFFFSFLLIYILLPMCMRLKDILKENEIQYLKETKSK